MTEKTNELEFEEWFNQIMDEKQIHTNNWPDFKDERKEVYEKREN